MRKIIIIALILMSILNGCTTKEDIGKREVIAKYSESKFGVGDIALNYEFNLVDGSKITLDALLKKYNCVLINFWATWCNPCQIEMPYLNEVAAEKDVAIVAISVNDEAQDIVSFQKENGFDNLIFATDDYYLSSSFNVESIPSTFVIDRNSCIVFNIQGSIGSKELIERVVNVFDAADYNKSLILSDYPNIEYQGKKNTDKELSNAICPLGKLKFESEEGYWPFEVIDKGVKATNVKYLATKSRIKTIVSANKDDVFALDYDIDTSLGANFFTFYVDGKLVRSLSGEDKGTITYSFAEAGNYVIEFGYEVGSYSLPTDSYVILSNAYIASNGDAKELLNKYPAIPQSLSSDELRVDILTNNVRALLIIDEKGNPLESILQGYYVESEEVDTRILLGKDFCVDLWYIYEYGYEEYYTSNNVKKVDDLGFRITFKTMANASFNEIEVKDMYNYESIHDICFLNSTDLFEDFIDFGEYYYFEYYYNLDEELLTVRFADEYYAERQNGKRGLIVCDRSGKAIKDVKISICHNDSCETIILDGTKYYFEGNEYKDASIKVISAPNGYVVDKDLSYSMPSGNDLVIVLDYEK